MKNNFFISGLCLLTASQTMEAQDNKPENVNILFIQADQHRYDCTGFSGKGLVKTPNIDKLAWKELFLLIPIRVYQQVVLPVKV